MDLEDTLCGSEAPAGTREYERTGAPPKSGLALIGSRDTTPRHGDNDPREKNDQPKDGDEGTDPESCVVGPDEVLRVLHEGVNSECGHRGCMEQYVAG